MLNLKAAIISLLIIFGSTITIVIWTLIIKLYAISILTVLIGVLAIVWIVKLGLIAITGDFVNNVDTSLVVQEWVKIPRKNGQFLWGLFYRAKSNPKSPKPYVIVAHGAGGRAQDLELGIVPLVLNGYHVLAFNQSGHGDEDHRSPGDGHCYPEIMVNIHDVVDFVLTQPDLIPGNPPRIGFMGLSTGGVMACTQAYLNPHLKMIIAMSGVHDFMALATKKAPIFSGQWWFRVSLKLGGMRIIYSEEENRIISPKYCLRPNDATNAKRLFMIHTADDPLPLEDARANQKLAGLPDANCLFLAKGGHNFRGQETVVIGQVHDLGYQISLISLLNNKSKRNRID